MGRRGGSGVVVEMSVFMLVSWSLLAPRWRLLARLLPNMKWKTELRSSAIHPFNEWGYELAVCCEIFEAEYSATL